LWSNIKKKEGKKMDNKMVHYERVAIDKARKLWLKGETIYCFPVYSKNDNVVDGIYITVFTNREKHIDFDTFVKNYKAVSRNNMRYYTQHFIDEV
jgi:hypothetical protein